MFCLQVLNSIVIDLLEPAGEYKLRGNTAVREERYDDAKQDYEQGEFLEELYVLINDSSACGRDCLPSCSKIAMGLSI